MKRGYDDRHDDRWRHDRHDDRQRGYGGGGGSSSYGSYSGGGGGSQQIYDQIHDIVPIKRNPVLAVVSEQASL